ncbi:MAG TPA: hypothetical protein DCG57_14485 [Candidatus Riflebacteria bacterium]|jgi:hypothetical protein|nr:MAG: hypothetical protein CVV41_16105 [Candidatus Riflebacteria bacterium HGW-Riflebacteria-1]HAE39815.1 hypothetical protein [Candidatus Riflebacteria bacterium]
MTDRPRNGLLTQTRNRYVFIALLALCGAGFSSLDIVALEPARRVFAQTSAKRETAAGKSKTRAKKGKATEKGKAVEVKADEPMFLQEADKTAGFMPEIFRCPECGYEQDEIGNCPDHTAIELVKILSAGRDPLAPAELDGNEDIIVDVPLKNIEFKKEAVTTPATESAQL